MYWYQWQFFGMHFFWWMFLGLAHRLVLICGFPRPPKLKAAAVPR